MSEQGMHSVHVVRGFDPSALFEKGFSLGSADLLQGGSFRDAVGRTTASLLMHACDKQGRSAFRGATVVLPPAAATAITEEAVFSALMTATNELRGFEVGEEEAAVLKRLVRVVNCPSLLVSDLLRTVEEQGSRRLVAVAEASQFRDPSIDQVMTFGASSVRISEDRWAPHVTSLCRQLVQVVQKTESYGLIHVPEVPAQKPANVEQLHSVDNCYVATLRYDADPEEVFNARAEAWMSMVLQNRLPEVVKELEGLKLPDGARLHALAQLLQRSGRDNETLDVIAQLRPHLRTLKAEANIQVAQLAHKAGDDDLAQELLPLGPDGIGDQLWLEEGLELATHLKDNDRIARFDARLAELVPGSERLRENRDRRLLVNCQDAKRGESHRFTTAGFTDQHWALQEQLSVFEPGYGAVVETARAFGQDWLELTVVCCAMHARSVGRTREAADVASLITSSELYGRQATQVLLASIRSMMLKELVPSEERDYYRQLFRSAFRFLAQHPEDQGVRSGLTTLLSVESCGDMGVPLVALTMLDLANQGIQVAGQTADSSKAPPLETDEGVRNSIENGMQWLGKLGGAEPGVTVMPRELVVAKPDNVVHAIGRLAHRASGQEGEDVDLEFLQQLVLLGCAISPHATEERDEDIRLMRLLACHFATEGQFQQARDLAEQVLLMGQTTPLRRRLAWQAFADIYHRCRNHVVALVGLACALASEVPVEKADLWHEVYTIHRVLRDLGLFDLARLFLPAMKTLLADMGFDPEKDPRIVAAELGVRLMEADDSATEPLRELLTEVTQACENELGDRNRLLPLAMLLGQAVLKAEGAGVDVSHGIREILQKALKQVGARSASTIRTVSAARPLPLDVLEMFNSVQRAIYASDAARDYAVIGIAARRLLESSPEGEPTPSDKAFAVELLADHTVVLPGKPPAMMVDWPVQYARELNQAGLDVAFLAVDGGGELTVTHVSGGEARSIEQPKHEQTFRRRFDAWLEDYPKDYGHIDRSEGNNIFYITMEKLDVRLPQSDKLVVVAEPLLQQLTANLVVMQPEDGGFGAFAGNRTSIGLVPSLSWLSSARSAERAGRTAYKAWISAQLDSELGEVAEPSEHGAAVREEPERERTLDIALRRLSGSFEEFGFVVDNGRRLPRGMRDAGLAVVTAHGGLNSESRYLHSIRDDGDLVEAPSALASALAGVELVILFVCSGGRIDKDPWDNSTTSLPKQLLNNGSRAVVASPWPLNVMVTYNWLDPFLREWEAGATVLEATKRANEVVARHFGDVPQYSLAMRVYGDVLMTRPTSEVGYGGAGGVKGP